MEHTKGDWEVTEEDVRGDNIFYRVEAKNYGLIALVDATPESDEAKANARLIAAAPDLLEMCEELLLTLLDAGYDPTISEVVQKAKTVIVAATS